MNERAASTKDPGDQPIYRRMALSTEQISRFGSILLRELLAHGLHDSVHVALRESGIEPLPSWQCEADHFDTRVERQNALADAFSEQIESDAAFRQSLAVIATNVLGRLTLPAPENHLTDQELLEFLACCVNTVDWRHIRDYERYAAYHAHLGACANCDGRLRAKHGAVAEGLCW